MVQDVVFAIGRFLEWSFGILEWSGNMPNYLFCMVGAVGMLYWLNLQKKYNQHAEQEGSMK